MKIIKFFFFIILLAGCNKSKGEIEINLLSKKITYSCDFDSINLRRFQNEKQRELSSNVVKLKFKNNTDKKLLFLIKGRELYKIQGLKINIYENNELILATDPSIHIAFNSDLERNAFRYYSEYDTYFFEKESSEYSKLGIDFNDLSISYLSQSVVLHPGEYCTISSILLFPYLKEDNLFNFREPVYFDLKEHKDYKFSITYKMDSKKLLSQLTVEQKKELKDNNIEIFNGEVETERIPVLNLYGLK
jgi:hypothetical protein